MILGGAKGALIGAVTPPATEGMGGATGSAVGKTWGSGFPTIPEGWAAFGRTSLPIPVPQPLLVAPLVAPKPTTSFEAQQVKLPPEKVTKLWEFCKAQDLQHLNNALGD